MNPRVYADRFLLWLLQQSGGSPHAVVETSDWVATEQVPVEALDAVLNDLEGRRLIEVLRDFDDGPPTVRATSAGLVEARTHVEARLDAAERISCAENSFLRWVFSQRGVSKFVEVS